MAWTLFPPRPGKCKCFFVRGTYCGIALDGESTDATDERTAKRIFGTWKDQAEKGKFVSRRERARLAEASAIEAANVRTFGKAAQAYIDAGNDPRFLPLIRTKWEDVQLADITNKQELIDALAVELYPEAPASTRNRQVHSPISAVLNHVGAGFRIKRPKGHRSKKSPFSYTDNEAFSVISAGYSLCQELGTFLDVLYYTGLRLGEALAIDVSWVKLDARDLSTGAPTPMILIPGDVTKNEEDRAVHLPPDAVAALRAHPRGLDRDGRLFKFHKGGEFAGRLHRAMELATERGCTTLTRFPERKRGFHLFRHTFGTRYCETNNTGPEALVDVGAWKDAACAELYRHKSTSEAARAADNLPSRREWLAARQGPNNVVAFAAPQVGVRTGEADAA